MTTYQPVAYKYTSTKEYIDAFPVAYRQWKADTSCQFIHGYSLSIKLYFGANELDVRSWVQDFSSLRPLKEQLEEWFDHCLLVSSTDPHKELLVALHNAKIAKITEVERTGCEGLADFLYKYINSIFLPSFGKGEAERIWCYRVEVRETQSNMAFREGFREWNEDLLA